jgi:hypothetical protein
VASLATLAGTNPVTVLVILGFAGIIVDVGCVAIRACAGHGDA